MNNPTLERIRDSMADVGGHHRYFTAIADRKQKRHLWISFASTVHLNAEAVSEYNFQHGRLRRLQHCGGAQG